MSRAKGRRYENELVHLLQELGIEAWRIPLSGAVGGLFSSDVHIKLDQEYQLEVKMRSSPQQAGLARLLPKLPLLCQGYVLAYLEQLDKPLILGGEGCKIPKKLLDWKKGAHGIAVRLPVRYTRPYGGASGWIIVLPDILWEQFRLKTSSG